VAKIFFIWVKFLGKLKFRLSPLSELCSCLSVGKLQLAAPQPF